MGVLPSMRQLPITGRVVAAALAAVRDHASVGVRLDELNDVARSAIAGARPSFLDYHPSWAPTPFPAHRGDQRRAGRRDHRSPGWRQTG